MAELSDDATVAPDTMMGKLVVIDLVREDGSLRHFSGYVFEFSLLRTDGGFASYNMVLRPWLDYLKLGQDCVAFNNLSVRAITERVFAPYLKRDWKHSIRNGDAEMTYVCQHNESHHNLLHRLWEARGWYYRYEHRADGHTLWLADDTVHNALPIYEGRDDMRFHDNGGSAEDDGIHQWRPWRRMASGKSTVTSYNFKDPRGARMSRDSMNKQGAVPQIEVHENRAVSTTSGCAKTSMILNDWWPNANKPHARRTRRRSPTTRSARARTASSRPSRPRHRSTARQLDRPW